MRKSAPAAIPTLRAATPVSSVSDAANRIAVVGHRTRETAQHVAHAVDVHRALHRPVVHGASPAPRDTVNGDATADRAQGHDRGQQQEYGKQRPERGSELKVEARPLDAGNADPRSGEDTIDIVEADDAGHHRAAQDPEDRRPQAQAPGRLERDAGNHGNRDDGTQRRGVAGCALRHLGQQAEDGRHGAHRQQHQHAARNGGRQDAAKPDDPRRQHELQQCRNDDQGREQTRAASFDCRNAGPDEGRRAAHHQHMARADPAVTDGLQRRGHTAYSDRCEHRPRQVGVGRAGGPHHHRRNQYRERHEQNRELHAQADGERGRRRLVGLVAQLRPTRWRMLGHVARALVQVHVPSERPELQVDIGCRSVELGGHQNVRSQDYSNTAFSVNATARRVRPASAILKAAPGDPTEGSGRPDDGACGGTDDGDIGPRGHLNATTQDSGAGSERAEAGPDDAGASHR